MEGMLSAQSRLTGLYAIAFPSTRATPTLSACPMSAWWTQIVPPLKSVRGKSVWTLVTVLSTPLVEPQTTEESAPVINTILEILMALLALQVRKQKVVLTLRD